MSVTSDLGHLIQMATLKALMDGGHGVGRLLPEVQECGLKHILFFDYCVYCVCTVLYQCFSKRTTPLEV